MQNDITMGRSRGVKVKKVSVGSNNKDVAGLFNQMLGTGSDVNLNICYPKYVNMKNRITNLLKLFRILCEGPVLRQYSEHTECIAEIMAFVDESSARIAGLFDKDLTEYEWNLNLVPDEDKADFSKRYEQIKEDPLIAQFIEVCNNLITYRKYIGDKEKLNHKFILQMPGVDFCPFPFTKLNIKSLFVQMTADRNYPDQSMSREQIDEQTKSIDQMIQITMLVLSKIYTLSYNLYKVYNSPDVDVDEFVNVVMSNLDEVKKHIPRCGKAFKKIEQSVGMLKENFTGYYKDFIVTKNSTTIMESFVLDVAKSTKADAETTRQFRVIISHYKKIAATQIKNPQLKMLFEKVNQNFAELDKKSGNIKKAEDSDDDESSSSCSE